MLDRLIRLSLEHRLPVLVGAVALLIYGGIELGRMPVDIFPDLSQPTVTVLAEAHGLTALRVTKREEVADAVAKAQQTPGTVVIEFVVEREDSVYPMVAAGAPLDQMIRRPEPKPAAKGSK